MCAENAEALEDDPLSPHLDKKVRLFVHDRTLLSQLTQFLETLKFSRVEVTQVQPSYMGAVQQLYPLLRKDDDIILINPPLVVSSGRTRLKKSMEEFFHEERNFITSKSSKDSLKMMSRCVPVYEAASHLQMRESTLLRLAEYGVSGAFILKEQDSLVGLPPARQKQLMQEQMVERFEEVKEYLTEFFSEDRDAAVKKIKERLSEKELNKKKTEADEWMKKADEYKKTHNFEEAINCYKKAIDIYPDDPDAYLESGRAFVRIQKYARALKRFNEASEIAQDLPTPNEEIGNLRITQVKEKIAQGADPNSDEVKQLLADAADNFENAITKAQKMKPLTREEAEESGEDRSRNAVSRIAGDIFKLDLGSVVGPTHDISKRLGNLARTALKDVTTGDVTIGAPQKITLGLGSADAGDFEEAEKLLFEAAEDKDYFNDACSELNYLGTRIRRQKGVKEAIRVYKKLLELQPPNRASVYFNLAVAHNMEKQKAQTAADLVEAVYTDPTLPKDLSFYQAPELFFVMKRILDIFSTAVRYSAKIKVPMEAKRTFIAMEKLEEHIDAGNRQEAFKLLFQISTKMPYFFKRYEPLCNPKMMTLVGQAIANFGAIAKPQVQKFVKYLKAVQKYEQEAKMPPALKECLKTLAEANHLLMSTGDQRKASALMAKGLFLFPKNLQRFDFYANPTMVNMAKEVNKKLSAIDREKIQ